jgi:hypothetical protein
MRGCTQRAIAHVTVVSYVNVGREDADSSLDPAVDVVNSLTDHRTGFSSFL